MSKITFTTEALKLLGPARADFEQFLRYHSVFDTFVIMGPTEIPEDDAPTKGHLFLKLWSSSQPEPQNYHENLFFALAAWLADFGTGQWKGAVYVKSPRLSPIRKGLKHPIDEIDSLANLYAEKSIGVTRSKLLGLSTTHPDTNQIGLDHLTGETCAKILRQFTSFNFVFPALLLSEPRTSNTTEAKFKVRLDSTACWPHGKVLLYRYLAYWALFQESPYDPNYQHATQQYTGNALFGAGYDWSKDPKEHIQLVEVLRDIRKLDLAYTAKAIEFWQMFPPEKHILLDLQVG